MPKTIFVVDDSITNLSMAEKVLEEQYDVITMTSAAKMFTLLEKVTPDMILLDVAMPDMSGFDAMKNLKANRLYSAIPVIFLTALADSYNEVYGIELGAVDFITKPFSELVLMHRIKHHLDIDELIKERTEQANAASKAKSDFLSNMNHEMRTPLNAIIGMTEIGKEAEDLEEAIYALNNVWEASTHLLSIVSDVLDMGKIETNQLKLVPIEFNFERMLQKAIATTHFRMEAKKQTLTVNIDKNIPCFIIEDELRIIQVIVNLLSNAAKFTPQGGSISLNAAFVGESPKDTEQESACCELRIEVTDNGIGISSEQQEKLFQPFVQADGGQTRKYDGTGLGLIISKNIVELMGGKIWIESELGKGAKLIFTVKTKKGEKILEDTDNDFTGKRLLLAEDIEINRAIFIKLLKIKNTVIEIDCAENGEEALEMITAGNNKYDIVFMDAQMPKMDGHEATRLIRALPAFSNTALPVIGMIADDSKEDIADCLAAGMNDYLGKPLDIDRVLEMLRKYLI